jgi:aminomethyltransferase
MPVWYNAPGSGMIAEHLWCRKNCAIFDVSHMGQLRMTGPDRIAFLERVTMADLAGSKSSLGKLSALLAEDGGVVDDLMVCPEEDHVAMVVNAACCEKDIAFMNAQIQKLKMRVEIRKLEDRCLIAIQGPKAPDVLKPLLPSYINLNGWPFMTGVVTYLDGRVQARITRCGYTGEDGFEISVPNSQGISIGTLLLKNPLCKLAGLASRDTLRLEAGLNLYGNEMDEKVGPIEAGMAFVLSKRRREEGGMNGFGRIKKSLKAPVTKKVGLVLEGKRPVRHENKVIDPDSGKTIGHITSGAPSPMLGVPIALAAIKPEKSKVGQQVKIEFGGKFINAKIVPLPFYPTRFFRMK